MRKVATVEKGFTSVGVHMGNTLLRYAGDYSDLLQTVREMVQNSLDSRANVISVIVNFRQRTIEVWDNGQGVDDKLFSQALNSIAHSIKGKKKLGRFGIGLISPLGKCENFTFTSATRKENIFRVWEFSTEEIHKQKDIESIPFDGRSDILFCHDPKKAGLKSGGATFVPWRTQVKMNKITEDSRIGKIDINSLEMEIIDCFGIVMKRNKVTVHLTFVPKEGEVEKRDVRASLAEGEKLEEYVISEKSCGQVIFRLFLAPARIGQRKGRIQIGEISNDYRLNAKQFCVTVCKLLDSEVLSILQSGIFNGEILCEKIDLHPNRKSYIENEALMDFCICISKWFREVGKKYLDDLHEEEKSLRHQKVGSRAMNFIRQWINESNVATLKEVIDGFKRGTIGPGHTEDPEPIGVQDVNSIATPGGVHREIQN